MNSILIALVVIFSVLTIITMGAGLFAMTKGGEFNEKYGNKIMQMRVWFQGLALAALVLAYFSYQG